ncbi:MAG: hypothetical protein GY801_14825 [bacterium]|nr:hypothetical protein [bacterium]
MMICNFNTTEKPALNMVGGKAKSLIATTQAGLPVPGGLALTVAFFQEWTDTMKAGDAWKTLVADPNKEHCDTVKALAQKLELTDGMEKALSAELKVLDGALFAVRSSSPEEDLRGSSFAGMYETFLGTTHDTLRETIANAYSSMYDFRVMGYKAQNNIDLEGTCISVIIQQQIASDVSGVGFSLNPLNNCYDEVAINASFGLGEAIVSGIVTPDQYIVEKVRMEIIEKKINEKKIALHLKANGGMEEKENSHANEQALSNEQILELADMIVNTENFYGFPVDTEWAFEGDTLYLLQARPITTHIPLFPELQTKPGEPKNIYIDLMGLTQGFTNSMSVLGMEIFSTILESIKGEIMIKAIDGTTPALHGRQYFNVTNMYKGAGEKLSKKFLDGYDGNIKRIFEELDMKEYVQGPTPASSKGLKWGLIKMTLKVLPSSLKAIFSDYHKVLDNYTQAADDIMKNADALSANGDILETSHKAMTDVGLVMNSAGVIIIGMLNMKKFRKMFKDQDIEADIINLCMDLAGNVTSEMGQQMFRLASYDEFKNTFSSEEFVSNIHQNAYSDEFMHDYNSYIRRFGARGFMEIDVATKRTWEDISIVFDKLKEINTEDSQITRVKEKRQASYDRLLALAKEKGFENKFVKAAKAMQDTFGYREHPKYVVVYVTGKLHNVMLEVGEEFVKAGRLENSYQIFDLHVDEIAQARKDSSVNIMKLRETNLKPYKATAHVKDWPLVIDSRGKTFKPKIQAKDGELSGDPIASGKVTGRAKVLHSPYEKSLNPGEILVTKATEPSWTPVFINAAGVVMEIGGPLQHGAIIAREYGIPCVSALMGAMEIIKDGDLLEVDGTNGIVKIIKE